MSFTSHPIIAGLTCYRGVLPNRIRVLMAPMAHTQAVSLSVTVIAGARDERKEDSGAAHFLEHMAFKGTDTRSALDIAEQFDAIGGHFNAGTGRESTTYYAKVLKEHQFTALDILADILQRSVFAPEEIEKERQVILQEIFMTRDTPDDYVFDLYQEACYGDNSMGRSILGPEENIKNFSADTLRGFMADKYTGDHIIITVAGALEPEAFFAKAQELFNSFAPTRSYVREAAPGFAGQKRLTDRELDQAHLVFGVPGAASADEELYRPLQITSMILGGGMSSRLFQEVREKRGLAYSVSAFPWGFCDSGIFSFYGGTSPDKVGEMAQVIIDETNKLANGEATADELSRAKMQIRASILMEQEKSGFIDSYMTRRETLHNDIQPLETLVEQIEAITAADVKQAAEFIATALEAKDIAVSCMGMPEAGAAAQKVLS